MSISRTRRMTAAAVTASLALAGLAVAGSTTGSALAAEEAASGAVLLAPYYTEADVTGDDQVTTDDLDVVEAAIGTTDGDAGWADVSAADTDDDGEITSADLADVAMRMLYDDGSFDVVEASAVQMQAAMNAGVVTAVELTQAYLDRIAALDTTVIDTDGVTGEEDTDRALNSIITTGDEDALAAAAESDAYRAEHGGPRSMLDGIPVLLKDNYDTEDMPTSAGNGTWADNQTETDAFMVSGLRSAGAVILGKASLDEFAYGFSSQFTTLSERGGTIYVASPYDTERTAGGSSGGTGASIAANLGAIGFGTDTGGSIRNPSTYNQLVGIRPTVGLASRDGIVPLALTQDTGGPIARSVADAAIALDAVTGVDENDPVTEEQEGLVPDSYTSYLDPTALEGTTIGYLTSMVGTNATTTRLFEQAKADLEAQGATVVEIDTSTDNPLAATLSEGSGSTNEFNHDLNDYIDAHLDADETVRSLQGLIDDGWMAPSRIGTYQTRADVTQEQYETWMSTHTVAIENGEEVTTGLMDDYGLDALMYPSGNPYSTQSTNLRLSPNTGMPAVTVPMGQATEADGTITGAGVNLELLGRNYTEGDLIGYAYDYEQATEHRTTPALYGEIDGDVFAGTGSDETAEAGDGSVTVDAPESVSAGERFTVTVSTDAADLYAYGVDLDYDTSVVKVVKGGVETPSTGERWVDRTPGSLALTHTKLGTSPSDNGETTLVTYTFKAKRAGATGIDVTSVSTVDSTGATTDADAEETAPTVTKRKTGTAVAAVAQRVGNGSKVRAAAVVVADDDAAPNGRVTFFVAGEKVGSKRLTEGTATVTVRTSRKGRAVVKAVYSGTAKYTRSVDRTRVSAR
ncbi:amidase family protein [Nocardioides bruguierae]|uniref:amidase family protein n=1 Tax=Nocardioides bruguierae TaxID=2945102 RepID=UPI002020420F|nr:amidase family protein [Nocardioides bruguierae]MCL8027234.1 amidase family protein [Nocardioides bruguierae]